MFTQLDASLMPAMDISVGTQYTGALDNIMKKEYNDVRKTAQDHLVSGNENRNIILENIKTDIETHVNDIKEKSPRAVINALYHGNNPLIDQFIAEKNSITYAGNDGGDKWKEFKSGVEKEEDVYRNDYDAFKLPKHQDELEQWYIENQTNNLVDEYNNIRYSGDNDKGIDINLIGK